MVELPISDSEKLACVDRWLEDVSNASRRWKTAKSAQETSECVVSYLTEIRGRVHGAPPDLEERMNAAIERNRENAFKLAEAAQRQSELESGFYDVLETVTPAEVAEAWRLRCMEQKTWAQCARMLHYNRQHLERISRSAKLAIYGLIPKAYREADRG